MKQSGCYSFRISSEVLLNCLVYETVAVFDDMFYEVVIDSQETANKCTIAPLAFRPDFHLFRAKGGTMLGPLQSTLLLHHKGDCLLEVRKGIGEVHGIAAIDCVWSQLNNLSSRIQGALPQLVRIPQGFVTAYPRRSEKNTDPTEGLATIEAIFVVSALLGHWDASLFSHYYFGRQFVELNSSRFLELGIPQAIDPDFLPTLVARPRNSQQRRKDRGRKF